MFSVYILRSLKNRRYYIGVSSQRDRRLDQHNAGESKSTAPYRPWEILYFEEFETIGEAYQRERFLKKFKSRSILDKIIKTKM